MIKLNVLIQMTDWTGSEKFNSISKEEKYLFVRGLEHQINKKMSDKRLTSKNYSTLFGLHSKIHEKTFEFSTKVNCDFANNFSVCDFYFKNAV